MNKFLSEKLLLENKLSDRNFWVEYWKNYEYEKVPAKVPFAKQTSKLKDIKSFIEIGGFPGVFAAYFYKHGCRDVSLLDFYIDKMMINNFEKINGIPEDTINCIETDFFEFETEKHYDCVFSYGFIEHFNDTEDVIERHCKLLNKKGKLLIVLPNFRGLNGFVQWIFDRKNLQVHNLNSMKIHVLKKILSNRSMKNAEIVYSSKPILWLEKTAGNVVIRKIVKILSFGLKLFPIKCRLLSPYIIIYAEKV